MQIPIRMPDERLSAFIDVYGHWCMPMENISTFSPGLIAFNLGGAYVEINGEQRCEKVLMGIANDPTMINYTIRGPGIVSLRCRTSACDRLFHIDPAEERGVVAMDRERHPRVAAVYDALREAPASEADWFEAMDKSLIALLPSAKPLGLAGKFVDLVKSSEVELSITEIADRLGCSPRTLERACKTRFGRTPKRLLRGQRLHRTLTMERQGAERVELMPDFAYSDLPHYLNEIRRLTGFNRAHMKQEENFGHDFPYRFEWPDGRAALTETELAEWNAEIDRRYQGNPA